MTTTIIAGDSWGVGEWQFDDKTSSLRVSHLGLETYLKNDFDNVVNLSKGGISNLDIATRLATWLERNAEQNLSKIFIFQTEYTRDYKFCKLNPDDFENIKNFYDIADQWIGRFYTRLSEIAENHDCKIYIIGGASDTLWFDNMNDDYPGCNIACQSLTNLLVNRSHRISDPTHSWYDKNTFEFVSLMKKRLSTSTDILKEINKGFERESLLRENPQYFYPDGIHPNRQGHKILYEFLKTQNIL